MGSLRNVLDVFVEFGLNWLNKVNDEVGCLNFECLRLLELGLCVLIGYD